MHGNMWEWCADHWHGNYEGAPEDGRAWIDDDAKENKNEMDKRVLRGGSRGLRAALCRSAYRFGARPSFRDVSIGLRVCCLPQD